LLQSSKNVQYIETPCWMPLFTLDVCVHAYLHRRRLDRLLIGPNCKLRLWEIVVPLATAKIISLHAVPQ